MPRDCPEGKIWHDMFQECVSANGKKPIPAPPQLPTRKLKATKAYRRKLLKGIVRRPCKHGMPPCKSGYKPKKSKTTGRTCCVKGKAAAKKGAKKPTRTIDGVKRAIYTDSKSGRKYYRKGGRRHFLTKGKKKAATKKRTVRKKAPKLGSYKTSSSGIRYRYVKSKTGNKYWKRVSKK